MFTVHATYPGQVLLMATILQLTVNATSARNLYSTIEQYKRIGHRNTILFEWLYKNLYTKMILSSVDADWRPRLQELKAQSAAFITLVDDIADNEDQRDVQLLNHLTQIPFGKRSDCDNPYYDVCWNMWREISEVVQSFPLYEDLREFLEFDLRQVMNAELHSLLINRYYPGASIIENDIYGHHGTLVMVHGTWDLMCSSRFNFAELGDIREGVYHASCAARLCNQINTYSRELDEGDFSSPIILHCRKIHNLSASQLLKKSGRELLKKSESYFEDQFRNHVAEIRKLSDRVKSVDMENLADVFESIYEDYRVREPYWITK
jgi:hypothetical protein